jgi:predicted nucleic acid-binding protein
VAQLWYLDTSAVAKLVRAERETPTLRRWLRDRRWISSDLLRTELRRAATRAGGRAPARAERLLGTLDLIRVGPDLFDAAGRLEPVSLRSLDALHVAAALALGDDLAGMVVYDERLAAAAHAAGVATAAPGRARGSR